MVDFEKGYLPFFFNWIDLMRDLHDDEIGMLVRAVCEHFRGGTERQLSREMMTIYLFMLDAARRVVDHQTNATAKARESANARWKKNERKPEVIDFDVDDAYGRALERTYGGESAAAEAGK